MIACISISWGETITGVADGNGHISWSRINSKYDAGYGAEMWLGVVSANASVTQTVTLSGNPSMGTVCDICEYSGVGSVDQTSNDSGYSIDGDTGTTNTTTEDNELWVGCVAHSANHEDITNATNGFTLLDGIHVNGVPIAYLEKIVSSKGQANSSITCNEELYWYGIIATFKAGITDLISVTISPTATQNISPDGSVVFTATATGNNGTVHYQWKKNLGIGSVNIKGATSSNYTYLSDKKDYDVNTTILIQCYVYDDSNNAISNATTININTDEIYMNHLLIAFGCLPLSSTTGDIATEYTEFKAKLSVTGLVVTSTTLAQFKTTVAAWGITQADT